MASDMSGRWYAGVLSLSGLVVLSLGGQMAWAQSSDDLLTAEQAAFQQAARAAASCVVQIESFGGLEKVDGELVSDGPTTGTIVDPDGWIISSLYSFRQQPASLLVALPDGTRAAARIVARDYSRELVLLKVEATSKLPAAKPSPLSEVLVGQWVIGLGRTFERDSVSQSVGIISALDRAYGKAIQTDAKVSPVNYGGPLIDLYGRVIGILAPISPGAILEGDSSQLYDSGIGFAVPLTDILTRLPALQAGQDIRSGKLGMVAVDQNELAGPVKVAGAAPGSPAAKAGLKPGDTIIEAGGQPVQLLAHLRHALGPRDAGTQFGFKVKRADQVIDLACTLVDQVPTYHLRYLGIEADDWTDGGVVIRTVLPKTPAAEAGLTPGMKIVKAAGVEVQSTSQLRQQLSIAELDDPWVLSVTETDAPPDVQPKQVKVKLTIWPLELSANDGAARSKGRAGDKERAIEDIELTLGDFPNKAWAWCPEPAGNDQAAGNDQIQGNDNAAQSKWIEKFGLLILLPAPGDVDRNKLREVWLPLLRAGWCVAVVQSGDKSRWSSEEIELVERVRSLVDEQRALDAARTVVAGQGVGGRLAFVAARVSKGKISGVMTLGTPLEGARLQRENSPNDNLHFMLVGIQELHAELLKQLRQSGYPALESPTGELTPGKWDDLPVERILGWLESLGRL